MASFLREGIARFRFLLCRQVAGYEMSIHVFKALSTLSTTVSSVSRSNA